MEWHEEFRAYARAFGKDEVAAILLRNGDREWIVWPTQTVEGLTFTLKADAILDDVPANDLQYVVGWVHSHPMGMNPNPSGTDEKQIRELAKDMAGAIAEMWIFGGHDYGTYSVTNAVHVHGMTFVSDTNTWYKRAPASQWDDDAEAFYKASMPAPKPSLGFVPSGTPEWWEKEMGASCIWCFNEVKENRELCDTCMELDDDEEAWEGINRIGMW